MNYDVIVVGGGHAGCEAAHATAVMGLKTLLISANKKNIADMPCNPSIGGTAKGIVVREIDALGGLMGKVADETHIQIKMLNNAKGPAVRSLRAQADKVTYPRVMLEKLENTPNLTIMEAMVEDLIVNDKTHKIKILSEENLEHFDLVFFSTGEDISKEYASKFIRLGAKVIDNSSYFRMDKNIPLVIPEINETDLLTNSNIYANPNCTTIMILLAIYPLEKMYGVEKINVSS